VSKIVGVRVTDGILKIVLGSSISIDLNWSRSIGWSWGRCICWGRCGGIVGALGPGKGNSSKGREGNDL
jgi:hypothetical protein